MRYHNVILNKLNVRTYTMCFVDEVENLTHCNSNIKFENIPLCLHPIPHPIHSTAAPPLCCQHMFQVGEYIISNIGAFSFQQQVKLHCMTLLVIL